MAQAATALIQRNADFSADPQAVALPWPGCRFWLELGHQNTAVRRRNLANRQGAYVFNAVAEGENYTRCAQGHVISAPGFTSTEQALFLVVRISPDQLAAAPTGTNRVIYSYMGGGMNLELNPNDNPASAGTDNLTINNNKQGGSAQSVQRYLKNAATGQGTGFASWTLITFRQYADKTLKSYVKSIDYEDIYSRTITAELLVGPSVIPIGGESNSGLPVDIAFAAAFDGPVSDEAHTAIVAMIKGRMASIGVDMGL